MYLARTPFVDIIELSNGHVKCDKPGHMDIRNDIVSFNLWHEFYNVVGQRNDRLIGGAYLDSPQGNFHVPSCMRIGGQRKLYFKIEHMCCKDDVEMCSGWINVEVDWSKCQQDCDQICKCNLELNGAIGLEWLNPIN